MSYLHNKRNEKIFFKRENLKIYMEDLIDNEGDGKNINEINNVVIKKIIVNNSNYYSLLLSKDNVNFMGFCFYGGLLKKGLYLNIKGYFNKHKLSERIFEYHINYIQIETKSFDFIKDIMDEYNNGIKNNISLDKILKTKGKKELYEIYKEKNILDKMLTEINIDEKIIFKIYSKWKDDTLNKLRVDPYLLLDYGLSFQECDKVSKVLGVFENLSERRIHGGIKYMFEKLNNNGSTYILEKDFNLYINKVLKVDKDNSFFYSFIERLKKQKELYLIDGCKITYKNTYIIEKFIVNKLKFFKENIEQKIPILDKSIINIIELYEEKKGIFLTENQKQAIIGSLSKRISIITGGPGTGKSTIQEVIYNVLKKKYDDDEIFFLTPTGVAGKNLSRIIGKEVETIHSFLGYNPYLTNHNGKLCKYNDDNKKENVKVIVIDEMSMVSNLLFYYLLRGLKFDEIKFIFVGDINQLNSVEYGQLLNDLIESKIPIFYLDKGFRFDNSIKDNANKILNLKKGEKLNLIEDKNFLIRNLYNEKLEKEYLYLKENNKFGSLKIENKKFDLTNYYKGIYLNLLEKIYKHYFEIGYTLDDIKVLSPINNNFYGVDNNNYYINNYILNKNKNNNESLEISGVKFYKGDIIINTLNDKDYNIYNGDIGVIKKIFVSNIKGREVKHFEILFNGDKDTKIISGYFLKNIKHAYSLSIHKSQGSGFKIIIVPIFNIGNNKNITKRLLYTGVTRAKEKVILIGNFGDNIDVFSSDDDRKTLIKDLFILD